MVGQRGGREGGRRGLGEGGGGRQQRCFMAEQPWCRCMRDAGRAWLLMVVVGSRFFSSLACGGLRWW
jgi:hypothetical protein